MGGGGDGGFTERQDRIDTQKQQARNALNVLFGVAPTSTTVDRAAFQGTTTGDTVDEQGNVVQGMGRGTFDQAGYDAAVAAAARQAEEAAANKTGLESLFAKTRTDAFTAGKTRLDEQKSQAGRDLKFELFARGLNGASTDIDQNALLGRTYTQGLTDLGAKADGAATQLRSDNEQARLQLLQSIDAGMDQGSALSSALGQMQVNSQKAASEATGTALGDLFANTGLIYQQNRVAQGRQNANNLLSGSTGSARTGGAGARSGTLSFAG